MLVKCLHYARRAGCVRRMLDIYAPLARAVRDVNVYLWSIASRIIRLLALGRRTATVFNGGNDSAVPETLAGAVTLTAASKRESCG